MRIKFNLTTPFWSIVVLMVGYGMLAFFLGRCLEFNFFRSDVLSYWLDSLAWQTPFHPFHVPAYPLIIAFARGITFGKLNPIALMMFVNLVAFLASATMVYQIIKNCGAGDELAVIGSIVFGLWPFVGLTYTVFPIADIPAIFFFLSGLTLYQRSQKLPATILLGLSLVTHKAMWVFVGLLIVCDFFFRKEFFSKWSLLYFVIIFFPIGVLWVSGSFHHQSATWLISNNNEVDLAFQVDLPFLDGLLGTFFTGGIKGILKGILILSMVAISSLAFYLSARLKYQSHYVGMMISLAVLILFLILNHHVIWAAVRFSRLLIIPLALIVNAKKDYLCNMRWSLPLTIIFVFFLVLSQFVYAWYMACVYFA
jgi:hypothetical protein